MVGVERVRTQVHSVARSRQTALGGKGSPREAARDADDRPVLRAYVIRVWAVVYRGFGALHLRTGTILSMHYSKGTIGAVHVRSSGSGSYIGGVAPCTFRNVRR